jgi:hypothetical protein
MNQATRSGLPVIDDKVRDKIIERTAEEGYLEEARQRMGDENPLLRELILKYLGTVSKEARVEALSTAVFVYHVLEQQGLADMESYQS